MHAPKESVTDREKNSDFAGGRAKLIFATVAWPSGKAEDCKSSIRQFESGRHLFYWFGDGITAAILRSWDKELELLTHLTF